MSLLDGRRVTKESPLDVLVQTGRGVAIFKPTTEAGKKWLEKHLGEVFIGQHQWEISLTAAALAVGAMRQAGLFVEEVAH